VDPIAFALLGWIAGWLLWGRPARLADTAPAGGPDALLRGRRTTIVIPARNEAAVLPLLLGDLAADEIAVDGRRIIVVDDGSDDGTGELARSFSGVTVIDAPPLPDGWTGKSWACHVGLHAVDHADDDVVVLLDADVRVQPGAVADAAAQAVRDGGLVSVQPFHRTERPYEQLSLFPGIIGLLGTGAGSRRRPPTGMFGPLVATTAGAYRAVGGHASVRDEIAEDVALGVRYRDEGLPVAIRLGGETVAFRMYPSGVRQLAEGWTKNMATGAGAVPLHRSLGVFLWITAAGSAVMSLPLVPGNAGVAPALGVAAYLAFVAQLLVIGRAVGTFGPLTALAYPVPLVTFMALFFRSAWRLRVRRSVQWRGRTIPVGGARPAA
jgi:4,4'-diaponeurosporenoate glycosyltransferase